MLFRWGRKKADCQWVKPLLSSYLDNQVSAEDGRRVEAHLRDCPSCSEELSSLRMTVGLLRRVPTVPVPRSFALAVPVVAPRPGLSPMFFYLRNATAAVAVLLIALIAGGFVLGASAPMYSARVPQADGVRLGTEVGPGQGEQAGKVEDRAANLEGDQRQALTKEPQPAAAPAPAEAPTPAGSPALAAAPLAAGAPTAPAEGWAEATGATAVRGTEGAGEGQSGAAAGAAPSAGAPAPAAGATPQPYRGIAAPAPAPTAESERPPARLPADVATASKQPAGAPTPELLTRYGEAASSALSLKLAEVGIAGVLVLLGAMTGAVWLRDRRRQGLP